MRARMAIIASGCEVEHREVVLSDRPDHLREISAAATVPCLEIEPGHVLAESLQIMSWALNQRDPFGWLPEASLLKTSDELIAWNDGEFKHNLDRFKYPVRYEGADPDAARASAEEFVARLEQLLREHSHLLRDEASMADVAVFPFVRQFSRVDEGWFTSTRYEAVRQWLARWEAAPLFARIMAKVPAWRAGDPVLPFTTAFPG